LLAAGKYGIGSRGANNANKFGGKNCVILAGHKNYLNEISHIN